MRTRINECRSGKAVAVLCALLLAVPVPAMAGMKDVTDPVLQEVLTNFGPRMPRFIEKHGSSVFVSDEAVTRASLMLALYEYDKSLKIPKKEYVSKQEFDDFRSKLSLQGRESTAPTSAAAAKIDIMQIINDLQPNMPILLDGSLASSKVFQNLKTELMAKVSSSGGGDSASARAELLELTRRMERLERGGSVSSSSSKSFDPGTSRQELEQMRDKLSAIERTMTSLAATSASSPASDEVRRSLGQTQNDIASLARRIDRMEKDGKTASEPHVDTVVRDDISNLKERVQQMETRTARSSSNEFKDAIVKAQNDMSRMARRIDDLETRPVQTASGVPVVNTRNLATKSELEDVYAKLSVIEKNIVMNDDMSAADVKKDLAQARREIARLEKKIEDVSRDGGSRAEFRSESPAYASLLRRVTFGLGVVAALFIAR